MMSSEAGTAMRPVSGVSGLLAVVNWLVIGVYLGGLIVLGLAMSRRHAGPADYFLASRSTR